jgi:hypothetical protein
LREADGFDVNPSKRALLNCCYGTGQIEIAILNKTLSESHSLVERKIPPRGSLRE